MNFSESNNPSKKPSIKLSPFQDQNLAVSLYTVLSILHRMRHELGLEAMIEYMDFYQKTIEKYNPQFQEAVGRALKLISVRKIYEDAMGNGDNQAPGSC